VLESHFFVCRALTVPAIHFVSSVCSCIHLSSFFLFCVRNNDGTSPSLLETRLVRPSHYTVPCRLPHTPPIIIPHPGHNLLSLRARVVRSAAYNVCVFRGYRSLTIASTYQPRAHSHCSLIAYRHAHHHRHHHVPARKDSLSLHWRSLNNVLGFMTYVRCLSHSYLRILTHWLLF
jgi:hypothetical protein